MSSHFLSQLRKKHDYTQAQVAEVVDVTRQTYALIETGRSELSLTQAKKLANLYGISLDDISNQHDTSPQVTISHLPQHKTETPLRIDVPANKIAVFKEVLLYILSKVGAKNNVGMTVLYKLLYFIDFDYYEKYEQQLMGLEYTKNHYGPTPVAFSKVVENMQAAEELVKVNNKYFDKDQVKFLPLRAADLTSLTDRQIAHIDDVLRRISDLNAHQLSELSHQDTPWLAARPGELLDYEAVFYRTPQLSRRDYGAQV